jgi:hypothetical protein
MVTQLLGKVNRGPHLTLMRGLHDASEGCQLHRSVPTVQLERSWTRISIGEKL